MPSVKAKWLKPATDLPFAEGILVLNNSGAAVAANDLVLIWGAQANALAITRADATSAIRTFPALFVAKHAIPNNRRGVIVTWTPLLVQSALRFMRLTFPTTVDGPLPRAPSPVRWAW